MEKFGENNYDKPITEPTNILKLEQRIELKRYIYIYIYRVFREECARLRENVP